MKYLLMLVVSVFFFALTYASAPTEFTTVDLRLIVFLFAGVFSTELLIAHLFSRYLILQNLILAGFATINILFVNLVLNEAFTGLSRYAQVLALLVALFILFTFMNMLDEKARYAKVLPVFLALATIGVLVQSLLSAAPVPKVAIEHGGTSAKNIRVVDFKSKPNVYFVGFDSIIPKVILRRNLGLQTTPYHEVLDTHFRRFSNFFADRIWTIHSLNSLLALDIGHFSEALQNRTDRYFFPGLIPSPLFEVFKYNGYETNTLYRSIYLGKSKGPHVDNFWVGPWRLQLHFGVCEFIDTRGLKALTFFGYCSLINRKTISQAFDQGDFLIEQMRNGLQKETPQIFVAYIYAPGHTASTFDKKDLGAADEYKQTYLKRSKEAARALKKIVTFVAEEDPEAIVYVFGDHGPGISRPDTFETDGTFYVQDWFAVYGGIHPSDRCAESFANPYNKDLMTVLQGAHMIIRCLTDGENAFFTLEDYRLPYFKNKVQARYEDYLYE